MKPLINTSLGKQAFMMENDAYSRLESYLSSIKSYIGSGVEGQEIIEDIESRMAERLQDKQHTVIDLPTIEAQIAALGEVHDLRAEKEVPKAPLIDKTNKRLFRNPDDKIIAGICSGLGAYFGIDPIWVRLAFVISVTIGGFGFGLYLLLWIIMPLAKTSEDKMHMRGEKLNLHTLESILRDRLEVIKSEDAKTLKATGEKVMDFFEKKTETFWKKSDQKDPGGK